MSNIRGLIRRVQLLIEKAPRPPVTIQLPYLVLNNEGKSEEGYNQAARLLAQSYSLPLQEYVSWNPDAEEGVDP